MFDWTQFDMVRVERELREQDLWRAAMLPQPASRRPIRSALAATLVTLADLLAAEQVGEGPAGRMAAGGAEA